MNGIPGNQQLQFARSANQPIGTKKKKTTGAQFKKLAFEVFERDGFQCQYCGKIHTLENMGLHAHHVKFKSQGGRDVKSNLISLCGFPCHRLLHDGFIPKRFKKIDGETC